MQRLGRVPPQHGRVLVSSCLAPGPTTGRHALCRGQGGSPRMLARCWKLEAKCRNEHGEERIDNGRHVEHNLFWQGSESSELQIRASKICQPMQTMPVSLCQLRFNQRSEGVCDINSCRFSESSTDRCGRRGSCCPSPCTQPLPLPLRHEYQR